MEGEPDGYDDGAGVVPFEALMEGAFVAFTAFGAFDLAIFGAFDDLVFGALDDFVLGALDDFNEATFGFI